MILVHAVILVFGVLTSVEIVKLARASNIVESLTETSVFGVIEKRELKFDL